MRIGVGMSALLLLVLLAAVSAPAVACTPPGTDHGSAVATSPADTGVTLEATLHHEGLVVLRSPTFR